MTEFPKCPVCGKTIENVSKITLGFPSTCGMVCNGKSKERLAKSIQTCIKKYNVKNVMQDENIKEKAKQTNILNLGVPWPLQSKEIHEKSKQTKLDKYNDENYTQLSFNIIIIY